MKLAFFNTEKYIKRIKSDICTRICIFHFAFTIIQGVCVCFKAWKSHQLFLNPACGKIVQNPVATQCMSYALMAVLVPHNSARLDHHCLLTS